MFVAERRPGLVIGLVAAGMVALSACSSGGSAPQTLPRLSTTPAAATSPAPPTSRAVELAEVKAVVRRYYALINGLSTSMDADALAALSEPRCPCRSFVKDVRDTKARQETYFGEIRIVSLTAVMDSADYAEVLADYNSSPGGTRSRTGRTLYRGRPHTGSVENFVLHKHGDAWLIASISVIHRGRPA